MKTFEIVLGVLFLIAFGIERWNAKRHHNREVMWRSTPTRPVRKWWKEEQTDDLDGDY